MEREGGSSRASKKIGRKKRGGVGEEGGKS